MILRRRLALMLLFIGLLILSIVPVGAQPFDVRPITADNINQLQVIETFGLGPLLDAGFVRGGQALAVVTQSGLALLNADDLAMETFIPFEPNPYADLPAGSRMTPVTVFTDATVTMSYQAITIRVDLETGQQEIATLPPSTNALVAASTAADQGLYVLLDDSLGLLRLSDGAPQQLVFPTEAGRLMFPIDAAYTPNGERFALLTRVEGMRVLLQVWDSASGERVASVDVLEEGAQDGRIFVDAATVVLAYDSGYVRYRLEDLSEVAREDGINALALSAADGGLLARGGPGENRGGLRVQFVDGSGVEVAALEDEVCARVSLNFFRPGGDRFYTSTRFPGSGGDAIRVYDTATGVRLGASPGFGAFVGDLAFSADGTRLFAGGGNSSPAPCAQVRNPTHGVSEYGLGQGRLPAAFYPTSAAAESLTLVDTLLVAAGGAGISAWRAGELLMSSQCPDNRCRIDDPALNADGSRLAVYSFGDQAIVVRDTAALDDQAALATLPAVETVFGRSLAWAGERLLYTADSRTIHVWTEGTAAGQPFAALDDLLPESPSLNISGLLYNAPTNQLVIQTLDVETRLRSINVVSLPADARPLTAISFMIDNIIDRPGVAFSPDGSLLVTSATNGESALPTTVIYDAATGAPLLELPRSVLPIQFSPDGSLLAAVNDRFEIEIWAIVGN